MPPESLFKVRLSIRHGSRFLGIPLSKPKSGDVAWVGLEITRMGPLDLPEAGHNIEIRWSSGVAKEVVGQTIGTAQRNPTFLGPHPVTVASGGTAEVGMRLESWPHTVDCFVDEYGNKLTYERNTNRVVVGRFRGISPEILWAQVGTIIGVVTLVVVIASRLL